MFFVLQNKTTKSQTDYYQNEHKTTHRNDKLNTHSQMERNRQRDGKNCTLNECITFNDNQKIIIFDQRLAFVRRKKRIE